jgi:FkbM family methyltransferase
MNLKNIIKSLVYKTGFDLHRLTVTSNPTFQLLKGIERFGIDLVFDIGANTGQFASELRTVGYRGRIVSFEPLSVAHKVLTVVAEDDPDWTIHRRTAIGDIDGEVEINISGNSVSSSLLPMLDSHASAAEDSVYIGSERVPINRLDLVASNYIHESDRYFIKIDTQGFEWQVLDGGPDTLSKAQGVLCELSLTPLYEGQRLWLDMIQRLKAEGFTLWSIQKGFTDSRDGRTLQLDAIFFRE